MLKKTPVPKTIYQVKITLRHSKPPIWRRLHIQSDVTLGKLHRIIQPLMGWWDGHLHQFRSGNTYYADLHHDDGLESFNDAIDENTIKLDAALTRESQKIIYEYDFGDNWEHELVLEEILQPEHGVRYPVCIGGKRSCPPEDCGGVSGYQDMLVIFKSQDHPEHDELVEWLAEGFDPDEFDLDEVNAAIQVIK